MESNCDVRTFDQLFIVSFNGKKECIRIIRHILKWKSPLLHTLDVSGRKTMHVAFSKSSKGGETEADLFADSKSFHNGERGSRNVPEDTHALHTQQIQFVDGKLMVPRDIEKIGFSAVHGWDWKNDGEPIEKFNLNDAGGGYGGKGKHGCVLNFTIVDSLIERVRRKNKKKKGNSVENENPQLRHTNNIKKQVGSADKRLKKIERVATKNIITKLAENIDMAAKCMDHKFHQPNQIESTFQVNYI